MGAPTAFAQFDYEGRVSVAYQGFNLAAGGYTGNAEYQNFGTTTYHTASRFNVLGAYVTDGLRLGMELISMPPIIRRRWLPPYVRRRRAWHLGLCVLQVRSGMVGVQPL